MNHVVSLDKDGHLIYKGLLTAKEIATIDEILNALKEEIPQIEADLEEAYGKTVLYRYHLGKFLGELLTKYDISVAERRRFMLPKALKSAFFRLGPMPSTSSRMLAVIALPRNSRWKVMANRCASSRTCFTR